MSRPATPADVEAICGSLPETWFGTSWGDVPTCKEAGVPTEYTPIDGFSLGDSTIENVGVRLAGSMTYQAITSKARWGSQRPSTTSHWAAGRLAPSPRPSTG